MLQSIMQHMNLQNIITGITTLVTAASAFCALTPTPKVGTKLGKVYKAVEVIAINVGKAKDKGIPSVK